MSDYTVKIKDLCDSLGAINVNIDDDEMVQIYLGGLSHKYGAFRITITTRENPPTFINLQSMLMVEENQLHLKSTVSNGQMLYTQRPQPQLWEHGEEWSRECTGCTISPIGVRKQ